MDKLKTIVPWGWTTLSIAILCWAGAVYADMTYEYDAAGRLTKVVYDDGSSMAFVNDNNRNVTAILALGAGAGPADIAILLLDDFDMLDTNASNTLSFQEVSPGFPGLTQAEFDALDANGDGELSRGELQGKCMPGAPANIQATDGTIPNEVEITWDAVSIADQYEVYRNTVNDSAAAMLIATTADTFFTDTSPPPVMNDGGCARRRGSIFYWVVALNACGMSPFSLSDTGFAGANKALKGRLVYEKALPSTILGESLRAASPDEELAIRLRSDEAIDPMSIWGHVEGNGFVSEAVEWFSISQSDGWVIYRPTEPLAVDQVITMVAGGTTVSGAALGPIAYEFLVVPRAEPGAMLWQPDGGDYDTSAMDLDAESSDSVVVSILSDTANDEYFAGPSQVFGVPQRVWLPVPDGIDPSDLKPFYYYTGELVHGWYPGEEVVGWLVPGSNLTVEIDGQPYFGFLVRHGGLVRLGKRDEETFASTLSASLPPSVLPLGAAILILLSAGKRSSRRRRRSLGK